MQNEQLLLTTCPNLIKALQPLHWYQQPYLDLLIDIWLESAPEINRSQKILLEMKEYDPRKDTITRRWVLTQPLAKWVEEVSFKRGFPFSYRQALDIIKGNANYGR